MTHDVADESSYDVIVVGGSLAGLQAALTLGRACRRVLVLDDGHPRNAPAARVNNFLGHDDVSPAQLLASARTMLAALDVEVIEDRVVDGDERPLGAWQLRASSGRRWSTRAVLLATGLVDELPDVPGLQPLWGTKVVACPHCHGWEVRDQPLAQIGMPGHLTRTVERALLLSRWSENVLLLTQAEVVDDLQARRLHRAGVDVETRTLVRVASDQGGLVLTLADGTALARRSLFVSPSQRQQSDLSRRLGCRVSTIGGSWVVQTDPAGRTSVPGVWAAGTTTQPALLGIAAAGAASTVAVALHAALLEQDLTDPAPRSPH